LPRSNVGAWLLPPLLDLARTAGGCCNLQTCLIWPLQSGQPDTRILRTFTKQSQQATAWPHGTATAEI
jgi:hypothetical protein